MYDDDIRVVLWEILERDCCLIIPSLSPASHSQGGGLLETYIYKQERRLSSGLSDITWNYKYRTDWLRLTSFISCNILHFSPHQPHSACPCHSNIVPLRYKSIVFFITTAWSMVKIKNHMMISWRKFFYPEINLFFYFLPITATYYVQRKLRGMYLLIFYHLVWHSLT